MAPKSKKLHLVAPQDEVKRPKIKLPPEYADEQEFLHEMRDQFGQDESFDYNNRVAGIEDSEFVVGEQWEDNVKSARIARRKPVLTINRIPAFVAQVMGSRIQNETVIKVLPDNGGTKDVAKVREGLMRSIQKTSRAEQAYDNALLGAIVCGIGNFQIELDYESDEVWDQSIRIARIPDHFAVLWDRSMTEPTGSDATRCFVIESMPYDTYMALYPWATPTSVISDRMPAEIANTTWYGEVDVRIVSYWTIRKRKRTIAMLNTGATVDVTDENRAEILLNVAQRPDGTPMIRDVMRSYACMYRCSGADVLEGPYELPISRVPVFRVPGWEIRVGSIMHRWGLVRNMKDPQRLHNYWRSAIAERIMQSPKNVWVASDTAVAGREKKWRDSHRSDDPLLIWNAESGQKPEPQPPVQVEQALIAQAEITSQDMKDVSNIHEANLGMPSNEVSGAAINARVRVSDTGTAIFNANLSKAIEECGRVANELVPVVYDTARVIKVMGDDSQQYMQAINDTTNPQSVDITAGKYSVTVSTGPSYATKRIEAAESMMALAQAMPQTFAQAPDILVESLDWPGSDKLAARFRKLLPPGVLSPNEQTPETQAAQAGQQQAQQVQQQLVLSKAQTDNAKAQSETALNFARAQNYATQARAIEPKIQNETLRTASETASRELHDHLATIELAHPVR
jgi:hypothetical protein